jgi:hypothetical protein
MEQTMFKKKKINADIVLYISQHNIKKSMELKSALELLNVEYEEQTTSEKMPYIYFAGRRENFSRAKGIIYEQIRINGNQINRTKRRWMHNHKISIREKRVGIWNRITRAVKFVMAKIK